MSLGASPYGAHALLRLDAAELVRAAPAIFQPATTGSHWSQLAIVVGRIESEGLYGPAFETARAYCAERLGLPPRDTEEYVKLWAMMTKHADLVDAARWEAVPKSHAILMRQLFALGAHPDELLDEDRGWTAEALQAELDRRRGRDPWGRFEVDAPTSTVVLADQALTLAIAELGLQEQGLEALTDRATRHQLLEAVCRAYIAGRVSPEPDERGLLLTAVAEIAHGLVSGRHPQGTDSFGNALLDLSNAVAGLLRAGWRPGLP